MELTNNGNVIHTLSGLKVAQFATENNGIAYLRHRLIACKRNALNTQTGLCGTIFSQNMKETVGFSGSCTVEGNSYIVIICALLICGCIANFYNCEFFSFFDSSSYGETEEFAAKFALILSICLGLMIASDFFSQCKVQISEVSGL